MSQLISKNDSPQMFDQIAKKYDRVNRLISFGQDVAWRQEMRSKLPHRQGFDLLDIATGTGDVVLSMVKDNDRLHMAYGIDLAQKMLDIAHDKAKAAGLQHRITFEKADAQALPFLENTFDAVTISFGIRNIPDLRLALMEMHRVLKKEGRVIILESSIPSNLLLRAGHWVYIHGLLPVIGYVFSGHDKAYRYLAQTMETFPYGDRFCKILKQMGFINVRSRTFMGGAATLYWAEK
jgi:demethylmenaquinone methyltransferase/2-methoxy-6-polyprenyl-1,4-benzoquinol methylase